MAPAGTHPLILHLTAARGPLHEFFGIGGFLTETAGKQLFVFTGGYAPKMRFRVLYRRTVEKMDRKAIPAPRPSALQICGFLRRPESQKSLH
jgi:hypothetical protein